MDVNDESTRGPIRTWVCDCGDPIEHWRGEGDHACSRCGRAWNAFGQRLRDDWAGNPSLYDDDLDDLEGFARQHAGM